MAQWHGAVPDIHFSRAGLASYSFMAARLNLLCQRHTGLVAAHFEASSLHILACVDCFVLSDILLVCHRRGYHRRRLMPARAKSTIPRPRLGPMILQVRRHARAPNKSLQGSGTDKVLGRVRSGVPLEQVMRAR